MTFPCNICGDTSCSSHVHVHVHVSFLQVLGFSPTSQKLVSKLIGYAKLLLGVNDCVILCVCMCMHEAL